jgi:hypothetical protein
MFMRAIVCTALLAAAAFAADVTGKWTAQVPGRDGQTREVTYNLKADGSALTGTTSGRGGDIQISDGKVEGDTVTFKVKMEFNGNSIVQNYTGKVAGDEIKFTQTREGGGGQPREFVAKKAK